MIKSYFLRMRGISIHSLRMEGDMKLKSRSDVIPYFNPLPPHGGRPFLAALHRPAANFNPLPPHGGRQKISIGQPMLFYFNPLPPHGGRQYALHISSSCPIFQSTPSAWRETEYLMGIIRKVVFQSTPSAWRETPAAVCVHNRRTQFQSTPSAWRETWKRTTASQMPWHFNPLPPHGGRPTSGYVNDGIYDISIHSLRMEGDVQFPFLQSVLQISIHSLRMEGDSGQKRHTGTVCQISIHSLRMEGDR